MLPKISLHPSILGQRMSAPAALQRGRGGRGKPRVLMNGGMCGRLSR